MIAIIPAAGVGARMAAELPKQYLQVAGATILDHAIAALLAEPRIKQVYVAVQADDEWFAQSNFCQHERVQRVAGGKNRSDSVLAGVQAALANQPPECLAVVHDAARPLLPLPLLQQLLDTAQQYPHLGALLALPARDTIKLAEANTDQRQVLVQSTLDRELIWLAQTPQVFQLGRLRTAIENALAQGLAITDEASAIEADGGQPILVRGSKQVMKVTDPEDLAVIEFYLQRQVVSLGAIAKE